MTAALEPTHPAPDDALRPRLVAFAHRFVRDHHEAEDVAQEALVRARAGWSGRRRPERTEAWLFRICRHAAIDHVRMRAVRRGVWGALPERGAEPEAPAPAMPPPPGALDLSALPAHQRLLVALHYGRGVGQRSLARMTGLSTAALRVRLFRARLRLLGESA